MTNIYDVLSKLHIKAHANLKAEIVDDLEKEDPPVEEAKSVLEGKETETVQENANESSKGDEKKRSSRDNKQDL